MSKAAPEAPADAATIAEIEKRNETASSQAFSQNIVSLSREDIRDLLKDRATLLRAQPAPEPLQNLIFPFQNCR